MKLKGTECMDRKGFTVLELMVAVAVTALLAAILLNVSTQVLNTQRLASSDLETNQVAQFVLDQIQEDLQCAIYRNDGNVWMAISILNSKENSGEWDFAKEGSPDGGKPIDDSLRLVKSHWTGDEVLADEEYDVFGQAVFEKSRFGAAGTWLRFFSQAPEVGQSNNSAAGTRAIAYQIIRYGLTSSSTSSKRYHLFRSDVSAKNTFAAGYNLHPEFGGYNKDAQTSSTDPNDPLTPRVPSSIINPIIPEGSDYSANAFSLAANIIDFGVRAYVVEKNSFGTGKLVQIFPLIDEFGMKSQGDQFLATSLTDYQVHDPLFHAFPDVIDLFVRVLTTQGARLLENFENETFQSKDEQNWWTIAEENSEVFVRRVKIYGKGL
jgi:prepilin-type N-terminal cleavage/methylation domain-containing protein